MDYFKIIIAAYLLFFLVHSLDADLGSCSIPTKCEDCLDYKLNTSDIRCFWCDSTEKCMKFPGILPKGCKSINWRFYGNCKVPGYVWVIVIPGLVFLFLTAILCAFCCFCCKCRWSKRSGALNEGVGVGLDKEETKFYRKRMELKAKHAERHAERKLKTDEIRKKYGLHRDDEDASTSNRYQQFENDPEA